MKKVMLAAAIVCAAVMSHGASLAWKLTGDTAYKYNQAFLINAANIAAVQDLLDAGGTDLLTSLATYELGGLQNATKTGAIGDKTASVSDPSALNPQSYAWVVIQTTDSGRTITDKSTGYIISAAETESALATANALVTGSATPTAFEINSKLAAAGALTGTVGNVPEPTSAMLLLLGVAGLALKRKRA